MAKSLTHRRSTDGPTMMPIADIMSIEKVSQSTASKMRCRAHGYGYSPLIPMSDRDASEYGWSYRRAMAMAQESADTHGHPERVYRGDAHVATVRPRPR